MINFFEDILNQRPIKVTPSNGVTLIALGVTLIAHGVTLIGGNIITVNKKTVISLASFLGRKTCGGMRE